MVLPGISGIIAGLGGAKKAPTIGAVAVTEQSSLISTVTANLPAASAGDLLVVMLAADHKETPSAAGWTAINLSGDALIWLLYKVATGSEGSTVTFSMSGSTRAAALAYAISGTDTSTAPEYVFSDIAGTAPTSLPCPTITPSWGASPDLFVAAAWDGTSPVVVTWPYPDSQTRAEMSVSLQMCSTRKTASEETPPDWVFDKTNAPGAGTWTIAFKPA